MFFFVVEVLFSIWFVCYFFLWLLLLSLSLLSFLSVAHEA